MKTKFFLLALLICGVWACSSSDDNDSNDDMPMVNTRLTATVNGERFESVQIFDSIEVGVNGKYMNISGTNSSNDRISVNVGNFDEPGTYEILPSFSSLSFRDGSNSKLYIFNAQNTNGSGTIAIDSDDGVEIKGSFSFEASTLNDSNDTVTVTEGEFTAEYYYPNN